MMKIIFTLLLFTFYCSSSFSQPLSVKSVEKWVKQCDDSTTTFNLPRLYLIEGIPFLDEKTIDNHLKNFSWNDPLVTVNYVSTRESPIGCAPPKLVILIHKALPLTKRKRRSLREVTKLFQDGQTPSIPKSPILIINNQVIDSNQARQQLGQLKTKNIEYIITMNRVPQVYYGQNAKNGLVKVYLKGYLPNK